DVGRDAVIREHLDLADLLADDPARAARDLQPSDRGDLVRLDVRAIPDAVPVQVGLHAPDVVFHDVEVDRDDRGVELLDPHASPPGCEAAGRRTRPTPPSARDGAQAPPACDAGPRP